MEKELLESIKTYAETDLPENISTDELQEKLMLLVNDLIKNNFEKLVSILYRIDVSEIKLKEMLHQNADKDAAEIIAKLIIERQRQKLKTRREFKQENKINEEDRW